MSAGGLTISVRNWLHYCCQPHFFRPHHGHDLIQIYCPLVHGAYPAEEMAESLFPCVDLVLYDHSIDRLGTQSYWIGTNSVVALWPACTAGRAMTCGGRSRRCAPRADAWVRAWSVPPAARLCRCYPPWVARLPLPPLVPTRPSLTSSSPADILSPAAAKPSPLPWSIIFFKNLKAWPLESHGHHVGAGRSATGRATPPRCRLRGRPPWLPSVSRSCSWRAAGRTAWTFL